MRRSEPWRWVAAARRSAGALVGLVLALGGCQPISEVIPDPVPRADLDRSDERVPTDGAGDPRASDEPAPGDEAGPTDTTPPGDRTPPGDETPPGDTATPIHLVIECEAGELAGAFEIVQDPSASGGAYVRSPPGTAAFNWDPSAPVLPPTRVEHVISVPRAATLYLRVLMAAGASTNDAFYAGFSINDLRRFYMPNSYFFDYSWVWVSFEQDTSRLQFNLAAGSRTMVLGLGEPESRCDRLFLTSNPLELAP